MAKNLFNNIYNPDVLSCLANLSNDEVFTPPNVVNSMLDMIPQELFKNPNTKFLDPACKSGVFLREIAKRLIIGLEPIFPDLQERLNHIFHNQLYGIAITEMTSLLTRRSLYCSKNADSEYSVVKFQNPEGNIRYEQIEHTWKNEKCVFCGAPKETYDRTKKLEAHAYEWIHVIDPKEIFDMQFDVITANPPYQLSDGGNGASAIPLYNKFVEAAKKLNPSYICMIIPSRWMTGGKGLDSFRKEMIHDRHLKVLHDFADSKECFTGVDIKGGVCYFLWDKQHNSTCHIYRHSNGEILESNRMLVDGDDDIFIRDYRLLEIKRKVVEFEEESLTRIVSTAKPYGLRGDTMRDAEKYGLPKFSDIKIEGGYEVLGLGDKQGRSWKYIPSNYPLPKNNGLDKWKVFVPKAYGCGAIGEAPGTPVLGTPGQLCTETFLQIGPFETKTEAENMLTYLKTKFFRALVGIKKQTQDATQKVYQFVPMQDFSKPWTDKELYEKYGLTEKEIAFIESAVKPME